MSSDEEPETISFKDAKKEANDRLHLIKKLITKTKKKELNHKKVDKEIGYVKDLKLANNSENTEQQNQQKSAIDENLLKVIHEDIPISKLKHLSRNKHNKSNRISHHHHDHQELKNDGMHNDDNTKKVIIEKDKKLMTKIVDDYEVVLLKKDAKLIRDNLAEKMNEFRKKNMNRPGIKARRIQISKLMSAIKNNK